MNKVEKSSDIIYEQPQKLHKNSQEKSLKNKNHQLIIINRSSSIFLWLQIFSFSALSANLFQFENYHQFTSEKNYLHFFYSLTISITRFHSI